MSEKILSIIFELMILSDAQAKAILSDKKKWPGRTNNWPIPGYKGYWLKACPSDSLQPYIHPAGRGKPKTYPDGMYLYVHENHFVDILAIEVCCNNQNFNDKRSRYTPTSGNVQATLPFAWMDSTITIQKGGQKKIWEASGWFKHKPTSSLMLTIRHLRVLFALTDDDYVKFRRNHLPAGHEYFCRHQDINQINQQEMRKFVRGMALMNHFRVHP